ncbi:MAG TPA: hypothetical protein EYH37_03685 [Aquifex aeolicus]|uniref:Uncharacterized protein n=1 Tax=Aquifex aeolicus TaxID=63363 RepID=A0A9D0YQG2_AQUAO|nr:hypothetical protein [Aquifex aeolicus]
MKKDYEKPVINRINLGLANKVGGKAFYSSRVRDNIDGVPIENLVDKFGPPFLSFPREGLGENLETLGGLLKTATPTGNLLDLIYSTKREKPRK